MALSPDGKIICSGGDENLKFWKIFEGNSDNSKNN